MEKNVALGKDPLGGILDPPPVRCAALISPHPGFLVHKRGCRQCLPASGSVRIK